MTTKFTPAQLRFFLNATLDDDRKAAGADKPPKTVLERFMEFDLPDGLRYRAAVLKRNIKSALAPTDMKIRDLYEAFQETVKDEGGEDEGKDGKPEDPEKAAARVETQKKVNEDIKQIEDEPIDFDGKLILATQLADPDHPLPEDLRVFLRIPGVYEEWLAPFTLDNLPEK